MSSTKSKRIDGSIVHKAIRFASKIFSEVTLNWYPMKNESYACFFGIGHFAYNLRGKSLVLGTDHCNILWFEMSDDPIIVRWRIFMQSFVVTIRQAVGLKKKVADWLSKLEQHYLEDANGHIDQFEERVDCLLFLTLEFDKADIYTPMTNDEQVYNVIDVEG